MKSAATRLISCSKFTTSSTSISGIFTTQCTNSSSSISKSPIQNLKPCSNSFALFYKPYKTHKFHINPFQNYSTHVGIVPYFPSKQKNNIGITPHFQTKSEKSSKIAEVFEPAKSSQKMIVAFKEMEANLDEDDIGLACYKIGFRLDEEGEDAQTILSFVNRALTVLDNVENNCSLSVAMTLRLLGSTNYRLRKFDDALECLNRADNILVKLDNDGEYDGNDIKIIHHAVLMDLANVQIATGMIVAAVDNLRKCLGIKEVLMGKDSTEFGNANREFAEFCVGSNNYKDGLPYGLKAFEIHLALLGENSVEVAQDRRVLSAIYLGLKDYDKALRETRLAQKAFKICGCSSDVIRAAIDDANIVVDLGMYEAALDTLEKVDQDSFQDSEVRSHFLISMGRVLVRQKKFTNAKSCFENACNLLDKQEMSKPLEVSEAYREIAMEYQDMKEFENAISFLKRAHAVLEKLPDEQHLEGSVLGRIGWLLLLTGKVTEATTYMESAAKIVKESYGSKHFAVGYVYNNLGVAYLELERLESAAKMFSSAKDLLDASLGPHHDDTIQACQNLAKAYAAMKSYPLAIEFQQKVTDAWEKYGHSEDEELREARRLLAQLKASAPDASSNFYLTKVLPLPYVSADRKTLRLLYPLVPIKPVKSR